jgi:hypothetical protein
MLTLDLTSSRLRTRVQLAIDETLQEPRMSASLLTTAAEQVEETIHRLLNEAKEHDFLERRSEPRVPFFQPATLMYRYRPEQPISVFTRELSKSGIGLLHAVPLERGEVAVSLASRGGTVTLRCYVLWCKACGPQWYLSGGQILGLIAKSGTAT